MKQFIFILTALYFFSACMHPPKRFTGATVILGSRQSTYINEIGMTISNAGCGRKWMADNGGERPYCELTVKMKDSIYHFGHSFEPFYIRNIKLIVDKMNPWSKEEDSVPPGGCRIIVTKLDDLAR